jgi:glycosyltransferase involved in cell wall biosynthesis
VDDASEDATAQVARDAGVTVIATQGPVGAGAARNLGAAATDADLLLFVDADVAVHPDAIDRMCAAFTEPEIVAVFGSYDDAPPDVSVVSRYRNLLHHHVHQTAPAEAHTFWTGLGAVRRHAFEEVGGFDPAFDFLEDVDLGLRLHAAGGRLRLDSAIQGKHLKRWTFGSMMRTDLWGRALPWLRLVRNGRMSPTVLNGGWRHRVSAASVAVGLLAPFFAIAWTPALLLLPAALAAFVVANSGFLRCLVRVGGVGFAIQAVPFHAAHYLAGLAGFVIFRVYNQGAARRARTRA